MLTPDPNYFKEHPFSGTQYYLKPRFPEFYEYLQTTYPGLKLSEQMYRYFYGGPGICPVCGKPTSYINFNKGYNVCCSTSCSRRYGPSVEKYKRTCLERYGVENPQQSEQTKEKSRRTCLERYGVEKPLQNPEIFEKVKRTNMERYGVEFAGQTEEGREKSKQTCMERYGVEFAAQSEQMKTKSRQTCMERYGVPTPMESEEIREKSRRTIRERYGVDSVMHVDEIKQRIVRTCLERYGVPNVMQNKEISSKSKKCLQRSFIARNPHIIQYKEEGRGWICKCPHPECNKCSTKTFSTPVQIYHDRLRRGCEICTNLFPINSSESHISNISQQVFRELDEYFAGYTTHYATKDYEQRVGKYSLDYFVEELNLVIEFNGDYWHANPNQYNADWYHPIMNKTAQEIWDKDKTRKEYLESLGYKVMVIWESDLIKKEE